MNTYAIIWDDGYPTTLYTSYIEAWQALREADESGEIIPIKEYLNK